MKRCKFLIIPITLIAVLCLAFGITGCSSEKDNEPPAICKYTLRVDLQNSSPDWSGIDVWYLCADVENISEHKIQVRLRCDFASEPMYSSWRTMEPNTPFICTLSIKIPSGWATANNDLYKKTTVDAVIIENDNSGNNNQTNTPNDDNGNNNKPDINDDNNNNIPITPIYPRHTLTYDLDYDGANNMAQQVAKDETVNLITPERTGYAFLGWYYNGNKIESGVWQYDSDITLTARWEEIYVPPVYTPHTLTYDYNYENAPTSTQTVKKDETVNLITPERTGYKFLGWYYNGNKIESGVWQYDSDVTLTARWEAIQYSVTYNTNDGILPDYVLNSFTVSSYNLPYTLPIPTKQNYNFVGWYETADFSDEPINIIPKNDLKNYTLYAKYTDEQLLEYELSFDETYYSVVGYKGTPQYITVPETYDGLPVKEIAPKAFENCKTLVNIFLPDSICKIGSSAFENCVRLTNINIPDSVTSIGSSAFYYCNSLASINIPDGVTSIGERAFMQCGSLTSINIPDSVSSIADYTFESCENLTSITIPNGVTSIGSMAFQNCNNLTSVIIGNGVKSIKSWAFNYCSKLTSIVIPDSVTSISTYDDTFPVHLYKRYGGCYYLPTKSSEYGFLYKAIANDITNVKIHDDCKIINDRAFYNCPNLISVTMSDSVTYIGSSAFEWCDSLTNIVISNRITRIDWGAFASCDSLTSVYYKGSAVDWSGIIIEINNYPIDTAILYYFTETEPTDNGNYWHYDTDGKTPVIWWRENV